MPVRPDRRPPETWEAVLWFAGPRQCGRGAVHVRKKRKKRRKWRGTHRAVPSGPRGDKSDGGSASPFTAAPPVGRTGGAQARLPSLFCFFRSVGLSSARRPMAARTGRARSRVRCCGRGCPPGDPDAAARCGARTRARAPCRGPARAFASVPTLPPCMRKPLRIGARSASIGSAITCRTPRCGGRRGRCGRWPASKPRVRGGGAKRRRCGPSPWRGSFSDDQRRPPHPTELAMPRRPAHDHRIVTTGRSPPFCPNTRGEHRAAHARPTRSRSRTPGAGAGAHDAARRQAIRPAVRISADGTVTTDRLRRAPPLADAGSSAVFAAIVVGGSRPGVLGSGALQ